MWQAMSYPAAHIAFQFLIGRLLSVMLVVWDVVGVLSFNSS